MRVPSEARLIAAFGDEIGRRIYQLAKRGGQLVREHPAVVSWAEQCTHDPRESSQAYAECLLCAINAELGGYGVEPIRGRYVDRYHQDIQAVYVNLGDTYDTTILYDHETDRLQITSWGDWVECHERQRQIA